LEAVEIADVVSSHLQIETFGASDQALTTMTLALRLADQLTRCIARSMVGLVATSQSPTDVTSRANMPTSSYDLVVIGGGPAGSTAAMTAAAFGKTVAIVERAGVLGGAGINTGTVPSKTLRESALLLSGWRARKLLGVSVVQRETAKVADFTHHEHHVVAIARREIEERVHQNHVAEFWGDAKFVGAHTILVTGADGTTLTLSGSVIFVATGSSPLHPPEFPFEHPRVNDSDKILEITEMPRALAVVGAGVIGAEYACTFAALGVEVHLIDGRDSLLSFLDSEVSATITRAMTDAGVRFHWKERVVRCDAPPAGDVRLTLSSGADLSVSDVLVAAGRRSNTEMLDLAAAGLTPGKRGLLTVDPHYRTKVPHIYAAGDVIGPPALAATGIEQARVAMCHAFGFITKDTSRLLPTGIYTIPEASMVGDTEQSLQGRGVDYIVGRAHYARNPRGRIIGDDFGFLKLLFRREDRRLLGVHVIGEQATELVHIGLIALLRDGDAELFTSACFNYPTLGDLYKTATYDALMKGLRHPTPAGSAPWVPCGLI
jgi:NAD(P) transhydrogenase